MEENKYYIPTIEEFNTKLIHEMFTVGNWFEIISTNHFDNFEKALKEDRIRVKYLDKEDIESLGYSFTAEKCGKNVFGNSELNVTTIWISLNNEIVEIIEVTPGFRTLLFKGRIKNKSELKVLFKQLEIEIKSEREHSELDELLKKENNGRTNSTTI